MGSIYLIRHGQASFGKADYDQLSDKGCQQAEILGSHLRSLVKPDRFYCGDLLRHSQTAEHFMAGFGERPCPTITHAGFNEFDHVQVLTNYRPEWKDHGVMTSEIMKHNAPAKVFQEAFIAALARWTSGAHDDEYQESWAEFKERCRAALQVVIAQSGRAENIIIFTSGGPISVIIQQVLSLGDREALSVNEVLANTGVTKLLFSGDRLNISYLNSYVHLELAGPEWLTYR